MYLCDQTTIVVDDTMKDISLLRWLMHGGIWRMIKIVANNPGITYEELKHQMQRDVKRVRIHRDRLLKYGIIRREKKLVDGIFRYVFFLNVNTVVLRLVR